MRASRVARGKKAGYPRGDEVGKVKGEGRRAHARLQFNQSSPRGCAPIRRPVNRKRSLGNLGSTGLRGCGRRGTRASPIDATVFSTRNASARMNFHARPRVFVTAPLIAIERTRPHRIEVCKLWNMRGRGRGGWVCLGPRARAGGRSRPAVITMQTRMVGLFDEFQTRCNADGRKHRLRVRSLYRIGFHLSRCGVIGLRDAFENFLSLLWIIK